MRTIKSILNQTVLPDEVIFSDDGSYDNTVEMILMYKDEFLSIGGHDSRFASAREDSDVFNRLVLGKFELPRATALYEKDD